jgi:hypothetical protein
MIRTGLPRSRFGPIMPQANRTRLDPPGRFHYQALRSAL